MPKNKDMACQTIDALAENLVHLSHRIHQHPELALKEHRAVELIMGTLKAQGFSAEVGIGGLETAFMATKATSRPGPHIAFLAEYDALPDIGHGCGHNVIAACAVGAFFGVAAVIEELGGKVSLIGTPAEEAHGGKITLIDSGVFDGVDFALMMHPTAGTSILGRGARAATAVKISFIGKSAHSSAPGTGINALSAVMATFYLIDMVRPTFLPADNVNGIVSNGGGASNVIPGEASAAFTLRAKTLADLERLVDVVSRAAEASASFIGATVKIDVEPKYAERYVSRTMSELFEKNMAVLGEAMQWADPSGLYGSSDIGNVSLKMPVIHDYLWIAPAGVNSHHKDFTAHAASPRADEVVVKGAKGLAMTAIDILSDLALAENIKEQHRTQLSTLLQ